MGTLGCIHDMMRRDKENRELRQRNRERMKETRRRMTECRHTEIPPTLSVEKLVNPEKPDVPLNKNDAFQKVQKRHVQEKR